MYKKYDYKLSDFKIERKKEDSKYYIKIDGNYVEVEKEVFHVCRSSMDQIKYQYKKEAAISVIYYDDFDNAAFFDTKSNSMLDEIYVNEVVEIVCLEISLFSEIDKRIAECIFLEEMGDRETARLLNISKSTVTYRKNRIREKIQKKIKKYLAID